MKSLHNFLFTLLLIPLLTGCSAVRFVPKGRSMLTRVHLTSNNPQVAAADYRNYVRQEANSRWLSTLKVPLGIYCLSGTNERNVLNRIVHRIGEAPVVYNDTLTGYSMAALRMALQSKGYLQARVDTTLTQKGRRVALTYRLLPGNRSYVHELRREFDNDTVRRLIMADSSNSKLYKGMPLDLALLGEERTRIVHRLQNSGYMNANNEYVSFVADTLPLSQAVRLTLRVQAPRGVDRRMAYQVYRIGRVSLTELNTEEAPTDSSFYRNITFEAAGHTRINRHTYVRNLFVLPDSLYRDLATQYTYQNLNALAAVNYSNIHYAQPAPGDSTVNVHLLVQLNKPNGISFDLEGTNTAGDFGGAATFTYTQRNLFRGAESFFLKFRGAYEAIRRLEGYRNQNYTEYGVEATLRFPTLPVSPGERNLRTYKGSTDFSVMYNSQNRPEFYRRVLTGTWSVDWNRHARPNLRHHLDIVSLNYVFMPWISDTFRRTYLEGDNPRYAVLRYSYENIFIMRAAYGFVYNSLRTPGSANLYRTNGYQIRAGVETAGNLLYGISKMLRMHKTADGSYAIFSIPYSQYVKFDVDFSKSVRLSENNSLAWHAAFGLAIPFGNSKVIPYEKRYFSGGANSVRGWNVRQLGPGRYAQKDGNIDFINQTGNLKIDLSMEYRSSLFWKFEGAAFVDAGNVWTTRGKTGPDGGQFRFDSFLRELAVSYGLGLRLNLNYFIVRFDGGMKAIDPAVPSGALHYPIFHPNLSRDFTLHFAVGLPF